MGDNGSEVPGIERSAAWVPTDDTARKAGIDPGSLYLAGRKWTPFGLTALGHALAVNLTTGGLVVSAVDLSIPYYALPLQIVRTFDAQEQHAQWDYLDTHPNTDPRLHLFGNWQFQQEAQISPAWNHAFPELLVSDGVGQSALFYRDYPDFVVNTQDGVALEECLRAYGVPGRILTDLGWKYSAYDSILRTRQQRFGVLTGHCHPETMVDPVDLRLWQFDPTTGTGHKYTSEYGYQQFIDTDGLRETNVQTLMSLVVDGLGHALSFQPVAAEPPYRSYRLSDGSGRSFRLDLGVFATFLDGDNPGGKAKTYLVSQVTDETRPSANVLAYQYDQERLIQVSYPGQGGGAPRVVRYGYDNTGNLTTITDPVGNAFTITYIEDLLDADDRLVPRLKVAQIADAEGNSLSYSYDHPHGRVVVTATGADGQSRSVTYSYQEDSADTRQRYITSETVNVTLGFSGNQVIQRQRVYTDDGRFLLKSAVDPLGNSTSYAYNAFNQVLSTTDATGHQRSYQYDLQPAPTADQPNRYDLLQVSETNVDLTGASFLVASSNQFQRYDTSSSGDPRDAVQSTHRIASRTDELGNVTSYSYDDPESHNPLSPTRIQDPLGKVTLRIYDATGLLLHETDPDGNTWQWSYNVQGKMLTMTDPNSCQWSWVYDAGTGWLTDATDALGKGPGDPAHSTHYTWNDVGQRTQDRDPVGAITQYAYFKNNRLASVTRYCPTAQQVAFSYDASGHVTGITDARGHTTSFLYDEAGRVYQTFRDSPTNPGIKLTLDLAGRVTAITDRNGQVSQYGYDPLGRVVSIQEPAWPAATPTSPGKAVAIQYDRLGRRLSVTDSQLPGPSLYCYDPAGNLTSQTDPYGWSLNYSYDTRNKLIHLSDGTGVIDVEFSWDDAGWLTSVTDSAYLDKSCTYRYYRKDGVKVDNLYRIELDKSRIARRFAYNVNRRLVSVQHDLAGRMLAAFGYAYGSDGLVAQVTGDHTGTYSYDGLKQLVQETDAGVQDAYDGAGNRLWRAAGAVAAEKQNVYDDDNCLLSTPSDGTTFTYDANGNLLVQQIAGGGKIHYTYDGANRLMSVDDGTSVVSYLYDADGRLLQRTLNQAGKSLVQRYRYVGPNLVGIADGTNTLQVAYTRDDAGRLLRRRSLATLTPTPSENPHSLFYLHDGLGSVCQLIDWDGKTHLRSDYDAWGTAEPSGMRADDEPFRYRAGYQDPATHLLNFGARWYAPGLGRWLSRDPLLINLVSQGKDVLPRFQDLTNLYTYVFNDPLNMTDFTGQDPSGPLGTLNRWWGSLQSGTRALVFVVVSAGSGQLVEPPTRTGRLAQVDEQAEVTHQEPSPASQSTTATRTSDVYHPPPRDFEAGQVLEGILGAGVVVLLVAAPEVTVPVVAVGRFIEWATE
jgi:RHS repeat-associated protein